METTRHFTATTYVVHDGATVLHEHPRLELWLPPGGHIMRDELPHEAAIREAREETGLAVDLLQIPEGATSPTARPLPAPASIMLEDINVHDEQVGHQHIDFIYYATTETRALDPIAGEVGAGRWVWFDRTDVRADDRLEPDVAERAIDAIAAADAHSSNDVT